MFQKRNDFEFVEILKQEPHHLRKIAAKTGLAPATALRALKTLQQENVVDYIREGKNTKYFLKETPEAKNYVFMTETYKQLKLLEQPLLRALSKELCEHTNGELIVLFGSYAKDTATKESDIDIYLETNNQELKKKLGKLSAKLSIHIGTLSKDTSLGKEIIRNHVILQNTERFYRIIL